MRYVMSDIHAEYGLFCKMLEKIGFSDSDLLYICGDIIEKGRDSVRLARMISTMPNVRVILGNHEYSFLKYYHSLAQECEGDFDSVFGGLREYFPEDGHLLDWETVDWLDGLPSYIEEDDFICVHAGLRLNSEGMPLPLSTTETEFLVHDRRFMLPETIHFGPKCVFFGHTQTNGICGEDKILAYKRRDRASVGNISDYYTIALDTGTWSSGVLGCFCIDSCRAFYVSK